MPHSVDERIAAALEASGERMASEIRAEMEGTVRALVDALRHGRWGAFWCRFEDPVKALHRLAELVGAAVRQPSDLAEAGVLAARLVGVVAEFAAVVIAHERASRSEEVSELRQHLELKDLFLHMAVHELRGPLSIANGYLSMIQDGTFAQLPEGLAAQSSHRLTQASGVRYAHFAVSAQVSTWK